MNKVTIACNSCEGLLEYGEFEFKSWATTKSKCTKTNCIRSVSNAIPMENIDKVYREANENEHL